MAAGLVNRFAECPPSEIGVHIASHKAGLDRCTVQAPFALQRNGSGEKHGQDRGIVRRGDRTQMGAQILLDAFGAGTGAGRGQPLP